MLFELKSIFTSLSFLGAVEYFSDTEKKISGACVLDSTADPGQDDILYVANASSLNNISEDFTPLNLAYVSVDIQTVLEDWQKGRILLHISTSTALETIVKAVNDYVKLATAQRLQDNYEKLILALSAGHGLQAIADIGSEVLENPLSIADTSYRLLASTTVFRENIDSYNLPGIFGEAITSSINAGHLSEESVKFLKSSKRYEQFVNNHSPHVFKKETGQNDSMQSPYNFIDCGVRIKGVMVAFLSVGDVNRPFSEGDLVYCKQLVNLVAIELQKSEFFIRNHGLEYEVLLNDLLEDRISDGLQIRLRLQNMNKKLKSDLQVVTIRRFVGASDGSAIQTVGQSSFRHFFPNCVSVIYKDDIILLISRDSKEELNAENNEAFLDLLETNNMKAGISEVFYDPIRMRHYYQQSVKALELGVDMQPEKQIYFYYQVSVFHAMEICAQSISLRDLCHPVIKDLNSSTDDGDTDLLKALYLWLYFCRDTTKITNTLHIHRSTLFYRLNKLKDILGGSLDDGNHVFQLMFSFKLIEYFSGFVKEEEPYWFKEVQDMLK